MSFENHHNFIRGNDSPYSRWADQMLDIWMKKRDQLDNNALRYHND
jgi:hypothetical protein